MSQEQRSSSPVAEAVQPDPIAPVSPAPQKPAASKRVAGPVVEFNVNGYEDFNLLALRALFMTDNDLTLQEIVDRCATLPGLRASLAVSPAGVTASAHSNADEEINHFISNSARSYEYFTGLASSMGIDGQGSFTLHSGPSIRTFFIEQNFCFAVLHSEAGFQPGVRDKLILTARSLANLAE